MNTIYIIIYKAIISTSARPPTRGPCAREVRGDMRGVCGTYAESMRKVCGGMRDVLSLSSLSLYLSLLSSLSLPAYTRILAAYFPRTPAYFPHTSRTLPAYSRILPAYSRILAPLGEYSYWPNGATNLDPVFGVGVYRNTVLLRAKPGVQTVCGCVARLGKY